MEIRELRYFAAIAELNSFSKASAQLRIAQPALSRQVHKLESKLGVELFLRHGRGVTLTPAGTMLLQKAGNILRDLRQAQDDVANCAADATGTLTLGVLPGAGRMLIPNLLARYRQSCPRVVVRVASGSSSLLYEELAHARVDVALMHDPPPVADLVQEKLLEEAMYLVGPPGPAASGSVTLEAVAGLELILPSAPHGLRQLVSGAFAAAGLAGPPVTEVEGLGIIKAMVQHGLGHTVLTHAAVADEVERGVLTALRIEQPVLGWTLAVAMRKELRPNRAAGEMMAALRSEVEGLVAAGSWRGRLH